MPKESKTGYINKGQEEIIKNTARSFKENLETLRSVIQEAENGN